jgi:hypothetical protein
VVLVVMELWCGKVKVWRACGGGCPYTAVVRRYSPKYKTNSSGALYFCGTAAETFAGEKTLKKEYITIT